MKDEVLKFLKEQDDYRSGEEISKKLGVTRAAVWKAINKLKEEGYEIFSCTRKGYKLGMTPNIVTPNEIKEDLKTKFLGQEIYYYDEIDSTNSEAKRLIRSGAKEGSLVVADSQKSGKGRLGKVWTSPPREGIWMSLILKPHILPSEASEITLIAGVGMCEAIQQVTGLKASIKWPNDIVVNGKKVCGILTEMTAQVERVESIVVGIGVNVNMNSFPEELPYATSLLIQGGRQYSRKKIIDQFLEIMEKDYETYVQQPSLKSIKERYEKNCISIGRKVKIIAQNKEYTALAQGIDDKGQLIVELEDGSKKVVSSGEVSVRGLYGYV